MAASHTRMGRSSGDFRLTSMAVLDRRWHADSRLTLAIAMTANILEWDVVADLDTPGWLWRTLITVSTHDFGSGVPNQNVEQMRSYSLLIAGWS